MPYLRDRGSSRSSYGGSSGRSSSHRSSGYRRPTPMSESDWSALADSNSASGLPGVSPSDFAKGPPPDPRPSDSYSQRWLKLVWMETYDAYATFVDAEKRKAYSFSDRAPLRVHVGGLDERTKLFALTITGAEASRQYALPEGVGGADFVHALLKLEQGAGWVYVQMVDPRQGSGNMVSAGGKLFTEGMALTQSLPTVITGRGPHLCIAFDAYAACLGRFYALQQYSSVDKGIREAIEGDCGTSRFSLRGMAGLGRGGSGELLLPVTPGLQTKLNDVQLRILKQLQGPVDFVQGPPGTGKSTFIVELLRTRVPSGSKVLLCTTTNKAIDSLAEKLHACGHRDVVAFGNASRLGPTSLTLTLQSHLERHKTYIAHAALASAATSAQRKWDDLAAVAEEKATAELELLMRTGALREGDPGFAAKRDDAEQRWLVALWRPEQKAWLRRLERLQAGLEELLGRPESSQRLAAYLADHASAFRLHDTRTEAIFTRTSQHAVEAVKQFLERLGHFLQATPSTAHALMKLQILETARFVVCTAATAVKLPARIGNELDALSLYPAHKSADTADNAAAGAADRLADALAGLSVGRAVAGDSDEHDSSEDEGKAVVKGLLAGVLKFVYVVLDEGGAMLEPDMVGTVIHGCRFLLCVGDHKQLPPFTTWRDAEQYKYNTSLLQRLASTPGVAHDHNMMTVQYRMPARLAAIVSDLFYDGTLATPPAIHATRTHPTPVVFQHVAGQEEKQGTSFKNMEEVHAVLRIVRGVAVPRRSGQAATVNIIAFHKPQSFALQRALTEEGVGGGVEVMTVDSMQGREADVVILSCVRTNGQLGFLANRNRLNVAISRAKQVLYIVGDRDSLRAGGSAAWRQLLDHGNITMQVA